ncbi:MAG TPA: SDR family NAD(P)-dependent oxidoreductase [Flavobacteriales bacterium]
MKKQIVMVTGATSGFGKAIAERFAKEGWNVIINGRRMERLEELAKQLEEAHGVAITSLCFDVRDNDAVCKAVASLSPDWQNIDVLVNNAGLALGKDPIHKGDLAQWNQMIDTNIKGLLYVTKAVTPFMVQRKQGIVINIGSIAGREVYSGGNVYSATKFAVDALTKSMRIDLLPHGVRVSQIAPGAAETEFSLVRFSGDEKKAKAVYQGYTPLHAEDIAEAAWFIASRPPHVCIQDMLILPTAQANATTFHKA